VNHEIQPKTDFSKTKIDFFTQKRRGSQHPLAAVETKEFNDNSLVMNLSCVRNIMYKRVLYHMQ